jgi:hypothetical protein
VPLQRELLGDTRPALWALLAAVLVLLAVACANVGGLLLVRSAARSHDLAVRLALGATRRHVITEALRNPLYCSRSAACWGLSWRWVSFARSGLLRQATFRASMA